MERLFDYVFSTPYELRLFVAVCFTWQSQFYTSYMRV